MKRLLGAFTLALGMALAGCSTDSIPGVFRLDIEQGNVVDQNMIAQLRPGMSRDEVRFIMGTPLIVDPFKDDRWDYVYTFSPEGKRREQRNVTLLFDGEALLKVRGDVARAEGPLEVASNAPTVVAVPPGRPRRNRGLLADWFEDDAIDTAEAARRDDTPVIGANEIPVLNEEADEDAADEARTDAEADDAESSEQERERTREQRRRDQQEEFYEDLLEEL